DVILEEESTEIQSLEALWEKLNKSKSDLRVNLNNQKIKDELTVDISKRIHSLEDEAQPFQSQKIQLESENQNLQQKLEKNDSTVSGDCMTLQRKLTEEGNYQLLPWVQGKEEEAQGTQEVLLIIRSQRKRRLKSFNIASSNETDGPTSLEIKLSGNNSKEDLNNLHVPDSALPTK
ncbi:hypothetical protein J0S82_003605, partial [Galemys pyrenaicus]